MAESLQNHQPTSRSASSARQMLAVRRFGRYRFAVYVLAISLVILGACTKQGDIPATKASVTNLDSGIVLTNEQYENLRLAHSVVTRGEAYEPVQVNGRIDVPPGRRRDFAFPISGVVATMRLLPAMSVKSGDLLYEIEGPDLIDIQQQYLTSKARLQYLKGDYLRQSELAKREASSEKLVQAAKMEYEVEKVQLRALEQKLLLCGFDLARVTDSTIVRRFPVRAPFDAYVEDVKVQPGQSADAGTTILTLIQIDTYTLYLTLFEKDLRHVHPGLSILAHSSTDTSIHVQARVLFVSPDVSPEHGIDVQCTVESFQGQLAPGMLVNAEIRSEAMPMDLIDAEAIVRFGTKSFIFEQTGEKSYRRIEVQAQGISGAKVGVRTHDGHILAGRKVVTQGAYGLLMALLNTDV